MAKKKPKFVHLHAHTEYSLLDGLSKISPLMNHVQDLGMDTVALSDHGVMYGAIEFYKKALDTGVKPIIGMEGYVTNKALDFDGDKKKIKNYHLLLLAKNFEGYQNLIRLTSIGHLEGYYKRPRVDRKTLKKYSKGIVCTSACVQGELAQALIEDDYEKAKKVAQWHLDVFGDDYYLEIQKHHYEDFLGNAPNTDIRSELVRQSEAEKKVNEGVLKIGKEMKIPVIATNDAHYIKKEDATAQDALVCVATGKNVSDTQRLRYIDTPSFYVTSPEEMAEKFIETPEVLENTVKIAEKCEIEITLGKYFFPEVQLDKGLTAVEQLKREAYKGLEEKFPDVTEEIKKRLEYELDVIIKKEYAAYFLIYQDMTRWAHERRIPINTRGSAAGSLASYCLGITTVDPIKYLLPFERFLNPFRPSAPDIDLDIADDKREEMLAYLVEKYGQEKVAQICTFGRMLARGGVRDIARVLGYPYETGDKIAKLIPQGAQGFPMTIQRALTESPELKTLYDTDRDAKKVIDLAEQVEGNARHVSVHAAGVVISPTHINDFTPTQNDSPGGEKVITQYEMHAVEDIGLVKLDVLGIRNLSILREAVERVSATGTDVNLQKIPIDDKKTFEMLTRGETMGTFQMGGSGMTRYLVELKPESIEDIMIMIALFRPGPMMNIDEYIARKHGKKPVTYYHPKMKKFLDKSLGVLVFQDDLLYTALELANYDWEEVDKFRKAVGKKIPEEMAKQHIKFVDGCVKHSKMTKKEAEGLWELFEPFQGYGFNKAHAASYGMVAYQTAYMKANYPVEFMAALLTAEASDSDKISQAVAECKRMDIKVLPPDINESNIGFSIVEDEESLDGKAIRFGLSAIKNVGNAAIEAILEARNEKKFISILDFFNRVDGRRVNKKVLESLVKVGALSRFGNRASILASLDELRSKAKPAGGVDGQQGLFFEEEQKEIEAQSTVTQMITDMPEFTDDELESLERELLGFSLSAKPLTEVLDKLVLHRSHKSDEITGAHELPDNVKVAGVVADKRVVTTKKSGQEMAFVTLEDETGPINLVVFPKMYSETKEIWDSLSPVLITGKIDNREDQTSILVDSVDTNESLKDKEGKYYITIPKGAGNDSLMELKNVLKDNPGSQKVSLIFEGNGKDEISIPFGVSWNPDLSQEVAGIFDQKATSSVK